MAFKFSKPSKTLSCRSFIDYGLPKAGKTYRLAIDPRVKILLVDMEGGDSVLEDAPNITVMKAETWEDVIEVGKAVSQGYFKVDGVGNIPLQTFDVIAFDSFTRLQDLAKDYVVRVMAPNRSREIKGTFGAQSDWGNLMTLLTGMVKAFHNYTKGTDSSKIINFVWLAHMDVEKNETTGKAISSKIQLQGSATSQTIMSIVDGLFVSTKEVMNGKTVYGLLTQPTAEYPYINADLRQSPKRERLPAAIPNASWYDILEHAGAYIPSKARREAKAKEEIASSEEEN